MSFSFFVNSNSKYERKYMMSFWVWPMLAFTSLVWYYTCFMPSSCLSGILWGKVESSSFPHVDNYLLMILLLTELPGHTRLCLLPQSQFCPIELCGDHFVHITGSPFL
jgi:hypothetical protein